MAVIILSAFFLFLLTYVIQFYIHRKNIYRVREQIGLKGPRTNWLLGNLHGFIERKQTIGYDDGYNWYLELHQKFGDTFAIFVGSLLNIIVSNEEDIKEIFVKNFSNFSDRYVPCFVEKSNLSKSLFFSTYSDGWKKCRSAISPIFSSGSMKLMYGVVNEKVETLLSILEEKSGSREQFDIQEYLHKQQNHPKFVFRDFKALTLDIIAKCAFAIDSNCQRDRNDEFYIHAKDFVKNIDYRHSWITTAGMFLQELGWLWKALYRFTGMYRAETPLVKGLNDLYERRISGKTETSEGVDLLKLMIDRNSRSSEKQISQQEIVENCFAVLLGGYDTSSISLSYCTYLLARHPEVQERLYQEIKKVEKEQGINYDSILSMKYLDAVYKENLRLYPPTFHGLIRVCLQDITIRDQFIPKGSCVTITPYTVHRNEDNWPNASQFQPERFLDDYTEKNSLKWIPFGVGPRICVGMRFAEMEIKTTIVKMLERFQISMDPGEPDLVPELEGVVMQPRDPIHVELKRRNS